MGNETCKIPVNGSAKTDSPSLTNGPSLTNSPVLTNGTAHYDQVLDTIVAQAARLMETDVCALYELDSQDSVLRIRAYQGLPEEYAHRIQVHLGQATVGQAVLEKRPAVVEDIKDLWRSFPGLTLAREMAEAVGIGSVMAVPVMIHDTAFGGIVAFYPEPRHFSQREINLLSIFADQAALAIENVRLAQRAELQAQEANALYAIASELTSNLDLSKVLGTIVAQTSRLLHFDACAIYLYDQERCLAIGQIASGVGQRVIGDFPILSVTGNRVTAGDGAAVGSEVTEVLTRRQPLAVEDVKQSESNTFRLWSRYGICAYLSVPLIARGEPIGLLLLADVHTPRRFKDEEISLAKRLGSLAAIAIERARLFQRLERSELRYRLLTENANDLIFSINREGIFTFINQRVSEVLGYRPEEIIGKHFSTFMVPDSLDLANQQFQQLLMDPFTRQTYEVEMLSRAGDVAFLEISASALLDNGQVLAQQGIARDITERKQMEQEIARRTQELLQSQQRQAEMQDYLSLVTRTLEDERKRIARELHDDTAQALVAISRRLDICAEMCVAGEQVVEPAALAARLEQVRDMVDRTLQGVRRFGRALRPTILDDLGLLPALDMLGQEVAEESGIKVKVKMVGQRFSLAPEVRLALYRIAQEALNNVRRHAGAHCARVTITFTPTEVNLTIKDDGVGFTPPGNLGGLVHGGHMGLAGMQERASLVGAKLRVGSAPGSGTVVEVSVPIVGTFSPAAPSSL